MRNKYSEAKYLIEELIRSGRHNKANRLIQSFNIANLTRDERLEYSTQARRLGLTIQALKALNKVVYPESKLTPSATQEELLSYALTLTSLGLKQQALQVYKSIRFNFNSDAILNYSYLLMNIWEYRLAAKNLRHFLKKFHNENNYKLFIAKINLTACNIAALEYDSSIAILNELIPELEKEKHYLLLGNCYELMGQCYFYNMNYEKAIKVLNRAHELLKNQKGRYLFYVKKWATLSKLYKNKNEIHSFNDIYHIKDEALAAKDWETVRECDYHLSILKKDVLLFKKVYFGTPFNGYRKKMRSHELYQKIGANKFLWKIGPINKNLTLDLSTGLFTDNNNLPPGENIHKLISFLCSDFYKSFSMSEIFEGVFPSSVYNPQHSNNNVYQLINRTRNYLNAKKIDLSIKCNDHNYVLNSNFGLLVEVEKKQKPPYKTKVYLDIIKKTHHFTYFDIQTAGKILNIPKSTCNYIIRDGLEKNLLRKYGQGKTTVYKIRRQNN